MNYLAHAYLSFSEPSVLVGNLIADFVKGRQIEKFSIGIQDGIRIHRQIDEFTDRHIVNREVKGVFSEVVGRYNASFLDVVYDHFLAVNTVYEPIGGWAYFAESVYEEVDRVLPGLPERFQRLFIYMKRENWLYNYRDIGLIQQSFERLSQRALYLDNENKIFEVFVSNYQLLADGFHAFFPDLVAYAESLQKANKLIDSGTDKRKVNGYKK
ncbi:MAG: ACP phosphodiesterase [Dysgonamonadaceae bacterium]